ncbi:MAG: phage antirepressor KilAC domain-containing protein [Flavobacteriaceae bacterium]
MLIRQFAKDLSDDTFKIGQNRLFEWMRKNKYLQNSNEPYQNYIDMGLFEVITRSVGSGIETFTTKTTKVTGRGAVYFAKKIKS